MEKKNVTDLKLDENLIVLKKHILVIVQDNLYNFVLIGKEKNKCNIISDGKIANYKYECGYFDQFDESPATYKVNYKSKNSTAKSIYDIDFGEHLNFLNDKQKQVLNQTEIKIGDLIDIQNSINQKELKKQQRENEIRDEYGF